MRHLSDQEIRRLDALPGQNVEDLVRIGRQRPIIECDDDLFIRERQGLRILHRADQRQFARLNHQHAARAERVRDCRDTLRASAGEPVENAVVRIADATSASAKTFGNDARLLCMPFFGRRLCNEPLPPSKTPIPDGWINVMFTIKRQSTHLLKRAAVDCLSLSLIQDI